MFAQLKAARTTTALLTSGQTALILAGCSTTAVRTTVVKLRVTRARNVHSVVKRVAMFSACPISLQRWYRWSRWFRRSRFIRRLRVLLPKPRYLAGLVALRWPAGAGRVPVGQRIQ